MVTTGFLFRGPSPSSTLPPALLHPVYCNELCRHVEGKQCVSRRKCNKPPSQYLTRCCDGAYETETHTM